MVQFSSSVVSQVMCNQFLLKKTSIKHCAVLIQIVNKMFNGNQIQIQPMGTRKISYRPSLRDTFKTNCTFSNANLFILIVLVSKNMKRERKKVELRYVCYLL